MMLKKTTLAAACGGLFALSLTSPAQAIQAIFPFGTNIDQYDVFIGSSSVDTVSNVDQFDSQGVAVSVFSKPLGSIVDGDTFTDYIILQTTSLNQNPSGTVAPDGTWEISQLVQVEGVMTSVANTTFEFTGVTTYDVQLDTDNDGDGLTLGGWGTASAVADFADGQQVLTTDHIMTEMRPAPFGGSFVSNTGTFSVVPCPPGSAQSLCGGGVFEAEFGLDEGADFNDPNAAGPGGDPFLNEAGVSVDSLFDVVENLVPAEYLAQLSSGQATAPITPSFLPADGSVPACGAADGSLDCEIVALSNWIGALFGAGPINPANVALFTLEVDPKTDLASRVPEPMTVVLMAGGLFGLGAARRFRRRGV